MSCNCVNVHMTMPCTYACLQLRTAISNGEKELEAVVLAMGGKFKSQGAKRAMVGA